MIDSMINTVVCNSLTVLCRLFRSDQEALKESVTWMAKNSALEDIIVLRAMLRDIEYTLKTSYDNDDRRIHQYCSIICTVFDTNMDKIVSRDKTNDLPLARQLLTYYLTKIKIPRIRIIELMTYSDYHMILYNLRKVNEYMDTGDAQTLALMNAINTQIYLTTNPDGK